MARILVTVGMGPWPFDRLIRALGPLCAEHEVFAQTGTSAVTPPCLHQQFVPFSDLQERIVAAEVIITHAGNTVRLVQRAGKVPIAVIPRSIESCMVRQIWSIPEKTRAEERRAHSLSSIIFQIGRLRVAPSLRSSAAL